MDKKGVNEATRAIYHQQHKKVASDPVAMKRFLGMFSEEYFQLPKNYFRGKHCLDAGCGDTAKLLIRLSHLGASSVIGLDLGTEFQATARANLLEHKVSESAFRLVSGSVDELPFSKNEFDFVACHGVIIHLADFDQAEKAFSELARVTKPGGRLYIVGGVVGGLFEDAIFPAVRDYYKRNPAFAELIDKLSTNDFGKAFDLIAKTMQERRQEVPDRATLEELFDNDLCVTIQNIIQAPVRLPLSEQWFLEQFKKNGFGQPKRLRRFVERRNVRKWFAPLHFAVEHPLSRLLYGSGNLEFIGQKE